MKKHCKILLSIVLCFFIFSIAASAHSGKTDSSGGHYNRSTGEYHYHHGYPAHQHQNGKCPYEFDDQTDHSSKSSSVKELPKKETANTGAILFCIILFIIFILLIVYGIVSAVKSRKRK